MICDVGDRIENVCYECGNEKMKITSVSKQKEGVFIWCKCELCGFSDDVTIYYDEKYKPRIDKSI